MAIARGLGLAENLVAAAEKRWRRQTKAAAAAAAGGSSEVTSAGAAVTGGAEDTSMAELAEVSGTGKVGGEGKEVERKGMIRMSIPLKNPESTRL